MITVVQKKLGLSQIGADQLERSHRIGPKQDEKGAPRKRAIIVRFRSEAIRDEVFRARVNLKEHTRDAQRRPGVPQRRFDGQTGYVRA